MAVKAELIALLVARTGCSAADCKRALQESDGNIQSAVESLRRRLVAKDARVAQLAPDGGETEPSPRIEAREITQDLPKQTRPDPTGTFVPKELFDPEHPTALAIYCSDGRFTRAVEELTDVHLGNRRLDTLTIAGGPALLTHGAAHPTETDVVRRSASFLIRGHHIRQVVMIAHAGCGFYKDRIPEPHADDRMKAQQIEELQMAARWIRVHHSGLDIRLYYATYDGDRIAFEPVAIDD